VKTPTPIMSATTIAAATITETVDASRGSRLGSTALPVPDTVMSAPSLGVARW
jgi:hypothetical protein